MDLSSLAELGKAAGVAGVAIGAIVLIASRFIEGASSLPRSQRGPMLRYVAIGAFALIALSLLAWLVSLLAGTSGGSSGTRVTTGNCSIATSGTATGNTVNCGPPQAAPEKPAPAEKKP
jgi:hypothetical protein